MLSSSHRFSTSEEDGEEVLERVASEIAITHEDAAATCEQRSIAPIHVAHFLGGETAVVLHEAITAP